MGDSERLPRKLAAILYADVAEYSRLTGEDEDATHRRLSEYLDLISTAVERHRGRVMHYAGDAVLAMFEAVVDALGCAAQVQRDLKVRNEQLPVERKVQFRIGVNMGDVIEDRGDIYGDGVNVAARLESLARPGGICISESVHTAVGNKLALVFEFLGEQQVKNIAKPVGAYRVVLDPDEQSPTTEGESNSRRARQRLTAVAALVVLVALAGWLGWQRPWKPAQDVSSKNGAIPLPDKPSIAVLPFVNMSGDPDQEYFADGIAEDLMTDLSKISGLFVISRNSAFTYKGRSVKTHQVAEELGVRYVLEGSVRKVGDQVRINAQLIDATSNGHLWAERYDGSVNNVFALQDKVTQKIVAALEVNLTPREKQQRDRKETDVPEAYDAFLRGWEHYRQRTPEHYAKARDYFVNALELAPDYRRAQAALASIYWKAYREGWWPKLKEERFRARSLAMEYLDEAVLDPTPLAYQVAAYIHLWRGHHKEAIAESEQAIDLDPNDADSYVALAEILILAGRSQEALELIEKARRLDPHNRAYHAYLLGLAQFGMDQFEAASVSLERAIELNPALWLSEDEVGQTWCDPCLVLTAAYGYLGQTESAQVLIRKLKNQWFNLNVNQLRYQWPFKDDSDWERFAEGLRKAGVPATQSDM